MNTEETLPNTGKLRPKFCILSLRGYDVHKLTQNQKNKGLVEARGLKAVLNSWADVYRAITKKQNPNRIRLLLEKFPPTPL